MPLAVLTRTVVRRRWRPLFLWGSLRAALQARRSDGYLGGSLRIARGPVFWTLTLWRDGSAVQAFRVSGVHAEQVPKMAGWASQAAMTAWKVEVNPTWNQAYERMSDNPRWVGLDHPDEWHREKRLEPTSGWALTVPVPGLRASVKEFDA